MSKTLFGLGAQFGSARELYEAAQKIRDAGYKRWDVHSPYPIHGMDAAMGLPGSKVSLFSLIGGAIGSLTAFTLVYYTSAIDYRLVVQGKPHFAFEPTFPVFFELTILLTAFFTVGSMLVLNLMPRYHHPVFEWDRFEKVTDDGFFLVIEASDPLYSEVETADLLRSVGGEHITRIEA
ncbi:MAG: DUF3341 domain-containing protein [Candidatus Methylacidiphilales bacterium]|nr:DUF3341 domain-containing protein [Candidatus Methylacidiphilales bacterium]